MSMNKIVEVSLIKEIITKNSIGAPVKTTQKIPLIGNYQSVSAQEFFRGGEKGLKPECVIKIWQAEYNGEKLLEYNSEPYIIYRTYKTEDGKIELYCQKDVGA